MLSNKLSKQAVLSEGEWILSSNNANGFQIPMNWSTGKKVLHTVIPCLHAFLITFGTSVSGPAIPALMAEFKISRTMAVLSITLYTEGLALGPLLFAPLSEIFGRRWVYVGASSCLLTFSAGSGVARNFTTFLVCRFLSGCLGSVSIAIGGGTLADLWPAGKKRGAAVLVFLLVSFLAPCVAPVVASYTLRAHHGDWRWTQWLMLMAGLPIWLLGLSIQETGTTALRGSKEPKGRAFIMRSVASPFRMICSDAILLLLTLHTAFAYGVIFSFFLSFKYVLASEHGFDDQEATLSYLSLILGYIFAITLCILLEKLSGAGHNPEQLLYGSIAGGILLFVGEAWYALAAHFAARWPILVASGILVGSGAFALFLSAMLYMSRIYSADFVSSAIAANGAVRYTLGATFPLFTMKMYGRLGAAWASGAFAFLSLLLVPIPLALCRYGEHLRRSKRIAHFLNNAQRPE